MRFLGKLLRQLVMPVLVLTALVFIVASGAWLAGNGSPNESFGVYVMARVLIVDGIGLFVAILVGWIGDGFV